MKKWILSILVAAMLAISSITFFSCEIIEINLQDIEGAKVQDQQEVAYKQTIHQPVD